MSTSSSYPVLSPTANSLPSGSPVYLIQGHSTPYPLADSLDHFQTPRMREGAITRVPLAREHTYAHLDVHDSLGSVRRDLFGASHPNLVASAMFFKKMIQLWQYLPMATDSLINNINSQGLSKWHWLYIAPMNIVSNIISVSLLPAVLVINVLASATFLGRFANNPEAQDLKCMKFFLRGFQISTVLGLVNFSKALFPGLPIANIFQDYRNYIGFEEIAQDL